MTNLDMQNLNRATIKHLIKNIEVGMPLTEVRNICEKFMLENGADSFWYWNVGAFVFSGDETTVSVSGKVYRTSERAIGNREKLLRMQKIYITVNGSKAYKWSSACINC